MNLNLNSERYATFGFINSKAVQGILKNGYTISEKTNEEGKPEWTFKWKSKKFEFSIEVQV